ncbi:DUF1365 domain-containing protein [Collimonas antrihumi]|uniref:DUF1365 domain-containing protein n=1 Tax=Collimonas antrihumi TaxID=1940615 RepID=UPI001B8ABA71|nr:DUF1365 domain-containing protein [Collimonas antrihumi]
MQTAPHQVQLCFGKVRHVRLKPKRNAFSYGVYYLRLPLRTLAESDFDNIFLSRNRFNLLSFHDKDYGDGTQSALDRIDALLKAEGIHDADGEIWLQTFPRVFGYAFNPISFWFCHAADNALRAVMCEVHNTFGEKHYYLLQGAAGADIAFGTELRANKVFHVSPFCGVEGVYRFRFMRTDRTVDQQQYEHTTARIEYDDATGALLLTSVCGSSLSGEPVSNRSVAKAMLAYPLMTFGVILRIHWQALKLWCKHIPFFNKPVPPSREVTR